MVATPTQSKKQEIHS